MLLQPSQNLQNRVALSPFFHNSHLIPHQIVNYKTPPLIVSCSASVSKVVNVRGTLDYERRPTIKWIDIYKSISLMDNRELGSGSVLTQWENEGKRLTKWELCRAVKELRKFKHFKPALEVYNWMSSRYKLSPSDSAIQLDLIAKVHGVSSAEDFFLKLPYTLKDRRIYGALLNAYVRAKMRDKAEVLMEEMRQKGYAIHSLPYNVMMTLYMSLKEYDKVDLVISEMIEKNIQLDLYSYNIWLSSCGFRGCVEKMEEVFEQVKRDKTVKPNWTTFSSMATMYIKMGLSERAEDCLRRLESRIKGRDRTAYHYLISLYGTLGKKDEVYRVWNIYKTVFPNITNLGYRSFISSLVRVGDIEGAEEIYKEWLSIKSSYDPRIGNLLMGWYVQHGNMVKAESFFETMTESGGEPNSNTWEILAEGNIQERRISEALSCLKEAFAAEGSQNWKPQPITVSAFLNLCKEEGDTTSKEVLEALLKESGYIEDNDYASLVRLAMDGAKVSSEVVKADDDEETHEGSEIFLSD